MSNDARNPILSAIWDGLTRRLHLSAAPQTVPVRGHIHFKHVQADGSVREFDLDNLIMDAGEDEVAQLVCGVAATAFDYIAIGTDDTAPDDSQTALGAEITTNGGSRTQDGSTGTSGNVATIDVTFNFTGSLAIKEVGLFNAASNGDMLARQVFSVINVGDGDALTVTWNITVGTAR